MKAKKKMTVIEGLIEGFETRSDRAAEAVIAKLAKVGPEVTLALLKAARNPRRPFVRKWSLQALGVVGDSRARGVLIAALRDERMTVRLHAIRGLGRMGGSKAVAPLISCLADDSGGIRMNALQSLGALKAKLPPRVLLKVLEDPKWYVRQMACRLSASSVSATVGRRLRLLAERDPRQAVRTEARAALERLRDGKKLSSSKTHRRMKA